MTLRSFAVIILLIYQYAAVNAVSDDDGVLVADSTPIAATGSDYPMPAGTKLDDGFCVGNNLQMSVDQCEDVLRRYEVNLRQQISGGNAFAAARLMALKLAGPYAIGCVVQTRIRALEMHICCVDCDRLILLANAALCCGNRCVLSTVDFRLKTVRCLKRKERIIFPLGCVFAVTSGVERSDLQSVNPVNLNVLLQNIASRYGGRLSLTASTQKFMTLVDQKLCRLLSSPDFVDDPDLGPILWKGLTVENGYVYNQNMYDLVRAWAELRQPIINPVYLNRLLHELIKSNGGYFPLVYENGGFGVVNVEDFCNEFLSKVRDSPLASKILRGLIIKADTFDGEKPSGLSLRDASSAGIDLTNPWRLNQRLHTIVQDYERDNAQGPEKHFSLGGKTDKAGAVAMHQDFCRMLRRYSLDPILGPIIWNGLIIKDGCVLGE